MLNHLKEERFTVAQLTEAYLNHPSSQHSDQKAARQFVYRNMLRMIKAGLLSKLMGDDGWPRYQLNASFTNEDKSRHPLTAMNSVAGGKTDTNASVSAHVLTERLNQHKSDMLCAMGEADEYKTLCNEHPALRDHAQPLYNEARERSALLLGKMKALESLLSRPPR